jgi:hypothetical protein
MEKSSETKFRRRQSNNKGDVTFKLRAKRDRYGATYYIASLDAPLMLDLSRCTFFVFTNGDNPEVSIRTTREEPREDDYEEVYEEGEESGG